MNKPRIMIVEDEGIVALDIQNRLLGFGYEVAAVAATGKEAVQRSIETRPTLVLMDIKLKGEMDGITAAQLIRSRLDVPIVFLTAYVDERTIQRASKTTPYGYLLKPFQDRELHTAITMALEHHQMASKASQYKRWLETVLRSIGEGVLVTDLGGKVQFVNRVAESLIGCEGSKVVGKDIRRVFPLVSRQVTPVAGQDRSDPCFSPHSAHQPLLVAKDGRNIPVEITVSKIRSDQEEACGFVLVFRDVSTRASAEAAFRCFAAELERRNEELDAYAHTVAHELVSPLSSLGGLSELLAARFQELSDNQLREHSQAIVACARKMTAVVNELLLMSSVRKRDAPAEPVEMGAILKDVEARLRHLIQKHDARIVAPKQWPVVLGYEPWIEEVWVNYVDNAIRYGGRPPRIELGATAEADGFVRFWVRDNGPGLTEQEQAELFKPYVRLEGRLSTSNGLGLSIVQRIVEKLDGRVSVLSEPGLGSEFSFSLRALAKHGENGRHKSAVTKKS